MSEVVQQLVTAPRQLATLRGLFPGVCGSQVRSTFLLAQDPPW